MAVVCREFDVSRKTGHKIFNRYKDFGLEGLIDRSRRPYRQANRLPFQIEALIVQLKKEHPSWGAPKIREKIRRRHTEISLPAISTVHAVQAEPQDFHLQVSAPCRTHKRRADRNRPPASLNCPDFTKSRRKPSGTRKSR